MDVTEKIHNTQGIAFVRSVVLTITDADNLCTYEEMISQCTLSKDLDRSARFYIPHKDLVIRTGSVNHSRQTNSNRPLRRIRCLKAYPGRVEPWNIFSSYLRNETVFLHLGI